MTGKLSSVEATLTRCTLQAKLTVFTLFLFSPRQRGGSLNFKGVYTGYKDVSCARKETPETCDQLEHRVCGILAGQGFCHVQRSAIYVM